MIPVTIQLRCHELVGVYLCHAPARYVLQDHRHDTIILQRCAEHAADYCIADWHRQGRGL